MDQRVMNATNQLIFDLMKKVIVFAAASVFVLASCRSGQHVKCEAYGGSAPTAVKKAPAKKAQTQLSIAPIKENK